MQFSNIVLYNVTVRGKDNDFSANVIMVALPFRTDAVLENDVAERLIRSSVVDDAVSLAAELKNVFLIGGLSPADACSISVNYVLSDKGVCFVDDSGFELNAKILTNNGSKEAADRFVGLTTAFRERSATTCRYIENALENIRLRSGSSGSEMLSTELN